MNHHGKPNTLQSTMKNERLGFDRHNMLLEIPMCQTTPLKILGIIESSVASRCAKQQTKTEYVSSYLPFSVANISAILYGIYGQ